VVGFASSITGCRRIDWYTTHYTFPNVWQAFLAFPFLDVLLFGRWMSVICINSFTVCLWDGNVTSHIPGLQILAYDALPGRKRLLEYVNCDVVARIRRIHPNKLMETIGRAQNVGYSGNEVMSSATFSIRYFLYIQSDDCAARFHRALSRRFRSGS
jgi:hypothetical protein